VLLAHHGGGGEVVTEEQLAVLAGAAAGAVSSGGLAVGEVAGAAGRRPGEGFGTGQSTASDVAVALLNEADTAILGLIVSLGGVWLRSITLMRWIVARCRIVGGV
jgi:hypothetical protein